MIRNILLTFFMTCTGFLSVALVLVVTGKAVRVPEGYTAALYHSGEQADQIELFNPPAKVAARR